MSITIAKVLGSAPALPTQPDTIFMVKSPDGTGELLVSDSTGDNIYSIGTKAISKIGVMGVKTIATSATEWYYISSHDLNKVYAVNCTDGSIALDPNYPDTFSYTAPSTPGLYGFTINGRKFDIEVLGA